MTLLYGKVFQEESLNGFMSLGRNVWTETRSVLQKLLSKDEVRVNMEEGDLLTAVPTAFPER